MKIQGLIILTILLTACNRIAENGQMNQGSSDVLQNSSEPHISSSSETAENFSSRSSVKMYKQGLYSNEIPIGWAVDTIGDMAFGKIAEYDGDGWFVRGDTDWNRIYVYRRSSSALDLIMSSAQKDPSITWDEKSISEKNVKIARYPSNDPPDKEKAGTTFFFVSWKTAKQPSQIANIIFIQQARNAQESADIEHAIATLNTDSYESDFLSLLSYRYKDTCPTDLSVWKDDCSDLN